MTKKKIGRSDNIVAIARAAYEAYVAKDLAAIEELIAEDFHFTSPLDNRIDRATYFARCWPNSEAIKSFDFINLVADGDRVFVTYEGRRANGRAFAIPRLSLCGAIGSLRSRSISAGQFHTKQDAVDSSKTTRIEIKKEK
jgi:SnoaL-like domain